MQDTNKVLLIGRLTRDLGQEDVSYTPSGTCITRFSVANNSSKKNVDGTYEDYANFFDVTLYGKIGETLKPYMTKGKQVAIVGRLKQDRWQDKQTGNNRSRVYIIADEVQLLGGKGEGASTGTSGSYQQQSFMQKNNASATQPQQQDFSGDEFPEDIPF